MAAPNQVGEVRRTRASSFVWSLIGGRRVRCSCWRRCRTSRSAAVVTVWLGAFCGLGVGERLHAAAGERRGRVPRPDVRRAHGALAAGAVPVARRLPYPVRASYRRLDELLRRRISTSTCRARALALWTAGALVARGAGSTRARLLKRYRLSRPEPLALVPKLKRPPATGVFIAFEGVEGAGKGTQIGMAEEYLRAQGHRRARHARARRHRARREDPRAAARPEDRQARRAQPRRCCSRRRARRR